MVAISAALLGCGPQKLIDHMVPDKERAIAEYYIDLLPTGNLPPIERDLAPSLKGPNIRESLQKAAALVPKEKPLSTKIIGYDVWTNGKTREVNISFERQYPDRWLIANTATRTTADSFTIIGLRVDPIPDSLENINRFTLANKSPLAYGILALAILIPLFTIYALVQCIRSKPRRRWLWIIFIVLGIGKLSINWTTGQRGIGLLNIQLFGASSAAAFYGPWIISISLPLGAILFLLLRRKIATRGTGVSTTPEV
jgi:hypothetical protein